MPNPEPKTRAKSDLSLDYGEYIVKYNNERLRQFVVIGTINEMVLAATTQSLSYMASLNHKPITVLIHTYGGDINSGLAIYDLIGRINRAGTPVDIMANGACMSMGAVILQAGRKRLCAPHTHFMLHQLRGSNEGTLGEQRDSYMHMEHLQKTLNNVLAKHTGHTAKAIDKLIDRKNYYISAEEALKLNLIDKIVG